MLYNVLPPLVFFASLGGIILVVSRVILRMHRETAIANINLHTTATVRAHPPLASRSKNIARLVVPNQKSVQVIKNRITHFFQNLRDSFSRTKKELQQLKDKGAKLGKSTAHKTTSATPQASSTGTSIKPPASPLRQALTQGTTKLQGARAILAAKTVNSLSSFKKLKARLPKRKQVIESAAMSSASSINTPGEARAKTLKTKLSLRITNNKPPATKQEKPKKLSKIFTKEPAQTPLAKARAALKEAQYQRAEDTLVPFIVKHPRDTRAYMLLGRSALGRHAWDEAIEAFEQAININPHTRQGYASLGYATYKAGKFTKAIEALQKAHDADPHNVNVIKRLLEIARRMDNAPMQRSLQEELVTIDKQAIRD